MSARLPYLLAFILGYVVSAVGSAQGEHARLGDFQTLSRSHSLKGKEDSDSLPDKCGLPVLSAALHNRASLSTTEQSALSSLLTRPLLDTSIQVGIFRIHFDTTGSNAPAMLDSLHQRIPGTVREYVDSVGSILEYTTFIQTNVLGYPPPPQDNGSGGGNEYDVYIWDIGSQSLYGSTTPESPIISKPDGGTFTTFLEIDNDFSFVHPDSNKGLPGLRVTIAHELHHAVQIGNYGYWTGDSYFYEITSVWMEDVVYTEVNDYYQYLRSSSGQFWHPETPFTSNSFIMYSRGIWGNFIAKRYGRDVMKRAWQEITNVRPLQAMNNALLELSPPSSFRQAFSEWNKWNFFTNTRADTVLYYPEGQSYPSIVSSTIEFSPPNGAVEGALAPLASKYYQVIRGEGSFVLGLANINYEAGLANSVALSPYRYLLNVQPIDNTYRLMGNGVYVKLDVADRTNWYDWSMGSSLSAGVPFPNPFLVDGRNQLSISVNSSTQLEGTLSVFSSNMDLVYSSLLQTKAHFSGEQVFLWNGTTNKGGIVQSGVYLFVLDVQDRQTIGKIAVIKK